MPKAGREFTPNINTKLNVELQDENKIKSLNFNATHNRIFGLTGWYKKNRIQHGDVLALIFREDKIQIGISKQGEIGTTEDANTIIDLSELSSGAKGNIVEDRIKELILLYGQGLLNVYKPVIDNEGIDLIVLKNGMFHPIFLQVKSRFNVHKRGNLNINISTKTFNSHHSFYILAASFNPENMEIDDNLLLVPSHDLERAGTSPQDGSKLRITSSLKDGTKNKWAKFMIRKQELADKLLEKFEEIDRYVK